MYECLIAVMMFGITIPLFFHFKYQKKKALSLAVKGLTTLMPCLMGLSTAMIYQTSGHWLIAAGLVMCLIADVAIGIRFEAGIVTFAMAHVLFIAAFVGMSKTSIMIVPIGIMLAVIAMLLFRSWWPRIEKQMRIPYIGYALLLMAMTALALEKGVMLRNALSLIAGLGAALFLLSDILLIRNKLVSVTRGSDTVSLYCYYAGIYFMMLAWRVY